jgi:molybdopterin synthase catalytic subunit
MIELTREPIDPASLTERVRSAQAGAVVTFLGTVRELTEGRRTTALDYEAYPEMARRELEKLEAAARQRWPMVECAIVHRFGRMELGDVSVAIAVSCPHRSQAFDACRFLIDQLKQVVPIWKCEHWADGTTQWVHPGLQT